MSERRPATYQDVLDAPEHMVAEIIDGELVLSPRPASKHSIVASNLNVELGAPFGHGRGGPGGWVFAIEPELHIGGHVLVPDLAGWRTDRMAEAPDAAYFTLRPDWVCEILSPSTERIDRVKKMRLYGSFGIPHMWLVHPIRHVLEAYRLTDGNWLRVAALDDETGAARVEPFQAVEIELARLWAHTPPWSGAAEAAAEYAR